MYSLAEHLIGKYVPLSDFWKTFHRNRGLSRHLLHPQGTTEVENQKWVGGHKDFERFCTDDF